MQDDERQRIVEDLRQLTKTIPYREAFRVQLRHRLMSHAETRGAHNSRRRGRTRFLISWSGFRKGIALTSLVALVVAVGTMAFIPSARAQVGEFLKVWFHLETDEWTIEFGGRQPAFTPLKPDYLPLTLSHAGGIGGTMEAFRMFFGEPDGKWLIIDQSQIPVDRTFPQGQQVRVDGEEAVLVIMRDGEIEVPLSPGMQLGPRVIRYEIASRLIWYSGDTRVELISNLAVQEIMDVARSMKHGEELP